MNSVLLVLLIADQRNPKCIGPGGGATLESQAKMRPEKSEILTFLEKASAETIAKIPFLA